MTADQRATSLALLNASASDFLGRVAAVSAAQWTASPASGWTLAQVAEHIVLTEGALLGKVQSLVAETPSELPLHDAVPLSRIMELLAGRQGRAEAPAHLWPVGDWSQSEAIARFQTQRELVLKFIDENDKLLDLYQAPNSFFGSLTAYQWLIYGPMHTRRHILQMDEVLQNLHRQQP